MKILLLGAAGRISRYVHQNILSETNHDLVLFARNATQRIPLTHPERETLIDGDFADKETVEQAMGDVDFVYLNEAANPAHIENIIEAMDNHHVEHLVGASSLGIYDEVPGKFGAWNKQMIGQYLTGHRACADLIEGSKLKYTLLRMAWLYDEAGNERYVLTDKGEPFVGTQVTRQAIARLVMDILSDPEKFAYRNVGVSEPNTEWDKPSFY